MFVLKKNLKDSGLEIHHNDKNIFNDLPSNLALCNVKQHKILDAFTVLRSVGYNVPEMPDETHVESLKNVVWLGKLIDNYDGVLAEAVAWFKQQVWEWHWEQNPCKPPSVEELALRRKFST